MKEPGRELDAEIAEKVMGTAAYAWVIDGASRSEAFPDKESAEKAHPVLAQWYRMGPLVLDGSVPCYSTDIAAAWLVVEKIRVTHDFSLRISVAPNPAQAYWTADFWDGQHNHAASIKDGTTAPHAICLAALAAIGEQGA